MPLEDSESPLPSKFASLLQSKKTARDGHAGVSSRGQSTSASRRLPPVSSLVTRKSNSRDRGK